MPQMVALFNGVGGGAVALISFVDLRQGPARAHGREPDPRAADPRSCSRQSWARSRSGARTSRSGSSRRSSPAGRSSCRASRSSTSRCWRSIACAVIIAAGSESRLLFVAILVGAALLGLFVLPIGGADMPVVISLLNAFTGLSAAAAGLALDNVALIVGGMLVGASGSILTMLMGEAMNRSIPNIIAGGFGGVTITSGASGDGDSGPLRSTGAADVAIQLAARRRSWSRRATAWQSRRRSTVRELAGRARRAGRSRRLCDPPRRRPHARPHERAARRGRRALRPSQGDGRDQSRVPADRRGARDRRERRDQSRRARMEESSPIYGMPILDVDKAAQVIVLKRSMDTGFAGIDNPLFYNDNTALLFGDAKESVAAVLVKALGPGSMAAGPPRTSHASCAWPASATFACSRLWPVLARPSSRRRRGSTHETSRSRSRADRSRPQPSSRGCSRRWRSTGASVCSKSAPATAGKPCCWRASSRTWWCRAPA